MIWLAYWALAALQVVDIITTRIAISLGASEINPIMAPIVGRLWLFILVKLGMVAYLGLLLLLSPEREVWLTYGVYALTIIYLVIAVTNTGQLLLPVEGT